MTTISTKSNEGALVVTTNDGHLDSASAVLLLKATNPEYNQPVLHIKQAGERGGAASIRIDDPNPDIEFVETDQQLRWENTRLRFSWTSYSLMAAKPMITALRGRGIVRYRRSADRRARPRFQPAGGIARVAVRIRHEGGLLFAGIVANDPDGDLKRPCWPTS